ncbi:cation diffusion facilitator family transporter [Hydrogenimonas sp.]
MNVHHHPVSRRNLALAVVLNIVITAAQLVGGVISGSLALLSDALHNFSDVMSLLISWFANRIATREADAKSTFGYRRAEILAALFNASALVGIGIYIVYEAIGRMMHPESIDSLWVIWLGVLGVLVNGGSIWLLHADARGNVNIKAAYLHLLGDVLTSVAVVVGGVLIHFWQIFWIDPLISIGIAIYLVYASAGLIRETVGVLMQFAPETVDIGRIAEEVRRVHGIENIHHIHLWRLGEHEIFLEAHVDFSSNIRLKEATQKIAEIEKLLNERFGITHVTLQPEYRRDDSKSLIGG